jgi:hypothetical protein
MMRFEFRFTPPDRERYGDGTYGLDVSPDGLGKVPLGLLERFEDSTGMKVLGDWLDRLGTNDLRAMRAYLWLSRLVAEPGWAVAFDDFEPNVIGTVTGPDFRYIQDAEGKPTRRAPKKTASRSRSGSSSPAARRRGSES